MSKPAPRWPALLLVAVGLASCVTLEVVHVQAYLMTAGAQVCTLDARFDCTTVALSRFAVLWGLPMPVWGIAGFLAMGAAALRRSRLLLPLAAFATAASIALLIEELLSIGAVCLFCEGVHATAAGLLLYAIMMRSRLDAMPSRQDLLEIFALPALFVILSMLFIPSYWALTAWQEQVPYPSGVDKDGRPWVGAEDPNVVVHEYTDYACKHCAVGTARMRQRLARNPGDLRIVRHQQPRHPCRPQSQGCAHARAAVCAGEQAKFWEMDSWLFMHAPGAMNVDYAPAAQALGLDLDALHACMERDDTYARADADYEEAVGNDIRATPGYMIDGQAYPPEAIMDAIDDRL